MSKNINRLFASLERSPALLEDLQRTSTRLKKEYKLRKIGLILSLGLIPILALATYISLSASVSYTSSSDLIPGGISKSTEGKNDLLKAFDTNKNGFRDLLAYLGIDRNALAQTTYENWQASSNLNLWNKKPYPYVNSREFRVNLGSNESFYAIPSEYVTFDYTKIAGWSGKSSSTGWFGIAEDNGNVYTYANIPTPDDESISYNLEATPVGRDNVYESPLQPGDLVAFSLRATNLSSSLLPLTMNVNIEDLLEYSTINEDLGGANFNKDKGTLTWPSVQISPGSTETRVFYVKIKNPVVSKLQNKHNFYSYNCSLDLAYGDSINLPVSCPYYKYVEMSINILDRVNIVTGVIIYFVYILIVILLWSRTKTQLSRIAIIKHESHQGPQ